MSFIWEDGKFKNRNELKCVVLCAGSGHRILPLSQNIPKVLIEYRGRPILDWVIDYWEAFTENFVFIVGYEKDKVIDFVNKRGLNPEFIEQDNPKGIADAICRAKDYVGDDFIVVLGDCMCSGSFDFPAMFSQGVGVYLTDNPDDIKKSYSVRIDEPSSIGEVVEKPQKLINNLCGMGYYFFNQKVFDFIKKGTPSKLRGEVEITDVIQGMINAGEKISPVFFKGLYINVNFPEDLR